MTGTLRRNTRCSPFTKVWLALFVLMTNREKRRRERKCIKLRTLTARHGWMDRYLVVNCIAAAWALLFPHHSSLSHVIRLLDIIEVLQCVDKTCRFFPRRCWKCLFFARRYQLVLFIHRRFISPAVWWENCRCCKWSVSMLTTLAYCGKRWCNVAFYFKSDVGYTHLISLTSAVSVLDDPTWSHGQMELFCKVEISYELLRCEMYNVIDSFLRCCKAALQTYRHNRS